eukprot:CAMPEP_0170651402 /NCGR_PEP_ID=MMETSP0224-20130122/46352_1 /TAXON_ID=285029 /ORGANISM="Togula jolla, Strain CCCM 725" /LENGTH=126 /DNA_ID=CAMNT_0010983199 /DNA_START=94 /DNA_END=474 /DNA_ORIENTATION=+
MSTAESLLVANCGPPSSPPYAFRRNTNSNIQRTAQIMKIDTQHDETTVWIHLAILFPEGDAVAEMVVPFVRTTVHHPVDGANGPRQPEAKEDVDAIAPSDVANGVVCGRILLSSNLRGQSVGQAGA